jgi:glycine cleavage system H protein
MMKLDPKARYAASHEWARKEGDEFVCGITDHAQESLSDVVYVELPEIGSDVYLPLGGEITAVNETLEDTPELVNQDPYGAGWMIRFRPSDPDEFDGLMDGSAYETFVAEEEG